MKELLKKIKRKYYGIDPNAENIATDELKLVLEICGKEKFILEIGTAKGQTTSRIAEDNYVVSIDPFLPDNINGLLMGNKPEAVADECMRNIQLKDVLLSPTTSEKAFRFWDKHIQRKFDVIFIDGEHSYDALVYDGNWLRYLKEDGILMMHDTDVQGVKAYIDQFIISKFDLIKTCKSLKVYKRK